VKNKIKELIAKFHNHSFIRYGIMAVTVVGIELASFWFINSVMKIHYLIATWVSLLIGIVLNWIGSRYYVFGFSKHTPKKEFTLVFVSSLVGVILQSLVVAFTVQSLNKAPLEGKVLAIIVTFFWNYWIRKRYIFKIT
jgi:putative flippase GtrA